MVLMAMQMMMTSRSDQDSNVETVISIKVHNYPDLLTTMNRKNDQDDTFRHSQPQNLQDDDQDDDRNDNDGTGCVVGEAGVCTDPDQTLHLSVLSLLGRVIMMIAMMLIEV